MKTSGLRKGQGAVLVAAISLVLTQQVHSQGPVITSFHGNGELSWTNQPGTNVFSIEWAPSLTNGWQSSLMPLAFVCSTTTANTVSVPMFFRVRQEGPAFEIPTRTIATDGNMSDWAGLPPVLIGAVGDDDYDLPGDDIQAMYLAKDTNFMYFAMTIADGAPLSAGNGHLHFQFALTSRGWDDLVTFTNRFAVFTSVQYHPPNWSVDTTLHVVDPLYENHVRPIQLQTYEPTTHLGVGTNCVEWKVPLKDCMITAGKYAEAWTHYDVNPSPSDAVIGTPLK